MVGLGTLDGPGGFSFASDISADGITIVGRSTSQGGEEAFRWISAATQRASRRSSFMVAPDPVAHPGIAASSTVTLRFANALPMNGASGNPPFRSGPPRRLFFLAFATSSTDLDSHASLPTMCVTTHGSRTGRSLMAPRFWPISRPC